MFREGKFIQHEKCSSSEWNFSRKIYSELLSRIFMTGQGSAMHEKGPGGGGDEIAKQCILIEFRAKQNSFPQKVFPPFCIISPTLRLAGTSS